MSLGLEQGPLGLRDQKGWDRGRDGGIGAGVREAVAIVRAAGLW